MTSDDSYKVPIAEDEFLISKEIERSVKQVGYSIAGIATDGQSAVEMVYSLKPDVVLMDIKMPGMSGLEAAALLQQKHPVPVVILTAHESRDLLQEAGKSGVGAYLTKPPNTDEIERAVTVAVARHQDLLTIQNMNKELIQQKIDLEKRTEELENALKEIDTLRGIIPICAHCKKVRSDDGFWEQVEEYVTSRSLATFSHSVCPECLKIHYSDFSIQE